jgi:hypothetical protein
LLRKLSEKPRIKLESGETGFYIGDIMAEVGAGYGVHFIIISVVGLPAIFLSPHGN